MSSVVNREHSVVPLPSPTLCDYRPRIVQLPSGFVLLLVTTKQLNNFFVDQCSDLRQRLYDHNVGRASSETDSAQMRPWGLLAFAVGFFRFYQNGAKLKLIK